MIRYAEDFPSNFIDRFHLRMGYSVSTLKFQNDSEHIDWSDLSLGIGLPFGKLGNQIDFAYTHTTIRDGTLINEFINSIQVGLTIGDIWFVKRRSR